MDAPAGSDNHEDRLDEKRGQLHSSRSTDKLVVPPLDDKSMRRINIKDSLTSDRRAGGELEKDFHPSLSFKVISLLVRLKQAS